MSKESESYRLDMLRHLKAKAEGPTPSEVLEAQKVVDKFRAEQAKARDAIPRFGLPLPNPDSCPQCFYVHARTTAMIAVPADDPSRYDRMKCRVCDYSEDRKFR